MITFVLATVKITIDFAAVAAVIGVLLPLVTSLLKHLRGVWPTQVVRVLALVVAGVVAVIYTGVDLGWSNLAFDKVVASWSIIYVAAQTSYEHLWKDTITEQKLEAIGS